MEIYNDIKKIASKHGTLSTIVETSLVQQIRIINATYKNQSYNKCDEQIINLCNKFLAVDECFRKYKPINNLAKLTKLTLTNNEFSKLNNGLVDLRNMIVTTNDGI